MADAGLAPGSWAGQQLAADTARVGAPVARQEVTVPSCAACNSLQVSIQALFYLLHGPKRLYGLTFSMCAPQLAEAQGAHMQECVVRYHGQTSSPLLGPDCMRLKAAHQRPPCTRSAAAALCVQLRPRRPAGGAGVQTLEPEDGAVQGAGASGCSSPGLEWACPGSQRCPGHIAVRL